MLKDDFLAADLGDRIDFSILYESPIRLRQSGGSAVDLDEAWNRKTLREDFRYLADTYFDEPTYTTLDDRPVIFVYATHLFTGAVGDAFQEATDAIDHDPYLISDLSLHEPWMDAFDAAGVYNTYRPSVAADGDFSDFIAHRDRVGENRKREAERAGLDYIPTVIPGYDDSLIRDNPVLERRPDGFRELCAEVRDRLDPEVNAVLITSFNEWPEYTSVEPAEEYGTTYLETVADELARADPPYLDPDYGTLAFDFNRTVRPENANRDLALMLDALELQDGRGETLAAYDIGVSDQEPVFGEGAYPPEQSPDPDSDWDTWRWLGGPGGRAALHMPVGDAEPATATVHGAPVEPGIAADVSYEDQRTDHVAFGERELQTYTVSLQA